MGKVFQITTSSLDTYGGIHIVQDRINKLIFLDQDHYTQEVDP
jgi:hypothetical protein